MINIRIPTSVSIKASHLEWILLVGVTLLAASLRFFRLDEWGFWIDEIHTINRAVWHYDPLSFFQFWTSLSIMLEAQALQFYGISEWSARLVPALIGVASIPILYLPTRRFFGPTTALIAALLLAVSPWHLFWSQNARFYTTLLLFYNLALFAFFIAIEEDRPLWLVIFFGLVWLAIRERTIAVFLIPVVVAYPIAVILLRFKQPRGLRLRNMLILLGPMVAVVLLDLANFLRGGGSFFLEQLETFAGQPIDDPFRLTYFIASSTGIPLMALGFFGGIYALIKKSRAGVLMFIAAVLPVVLLVCLSPFIFTKDRYVFTTLPGWIILAAYAIHQITARLQHIDRILAAGLLFIFLADAVGNHILYFQTNNGNRRNWRAAFGLIQDRRMPDDRIISTRPEIGSYYLGEDVVWMGDVPPEMVEESNTRFWFVTDSESVWVTGEIYSWMKQNAELVDNWTLRMPEDMSLSLYLYDPQCVCRNR